MIGSIRKNIKEVAWFAITLILFYVWISGLENSIYSGGDSADLWKTITTWGTDHVYGSYVLYKGLFAVYPYVWFYKLAVLFGMRSTSFIMIYHALLFTYITVIGLPTLVRHLTEQPVAIWQRILLTIICFFAWKTTGALSEIMVDLPSAACFILAVNAINRQNERTGTYLNAIYTGLIIGICFCFSGQYIPAVMCLLIYMVLRFLTVFKLSRRKGLAVTSLIIVGILAVNYANTMFNYNIVDPMRQNGAWIPYGEVWMSRAFVYLNSKYLLFGNPAMENSRYVAMLVNQFGSDTAHQMVERAGQGLYGWSIGEYLSFIAKYPLDIFTQFFARGFISLSPDSANRSAFMLFTSYTLVYIALFTVARKVKTVKQFFKKEIWIVLSFFATLIAPMVMTMEMRYAISLQGFVYAFALCSSNIKLIFSKALTTWKQIFKMKMTLSEISFPWSFVGYIIFMAMCFSFIAVLYETAEAGSAILFN